MVKSYLKYEQTEVFGVVATTHSNIVWTKDDQDNGASRETGAGKAYVGANEEVLCWDVKKGELKSRWKDKDCSAQVTVIAQSKTDPDLFAVGHADGSIRLWDSRIATIVITFNGHRSAVTTLAFDYQGVRLASGSKDTDIIIWDLVSETGLFKLRGHKNQITGLHFLQPAPDDDISNTDSETFLLSTSKDALIKVWDVSAQYCVETHVTQSNGECWSLAVSPDGNGCMTGGNDGQVAVWTINYQALSNLGASKSTDNKILSQQGTFDKQARDSTLAISFHPTTNLVAFHGAEKAIELFKIRTPSEIQRAMARKRRRRKEKSSTNGAVDEEMTNGTEQDEPAPITEVVVPHVVVRTGGKVRSFTWAGGRSSKAIRMLIAPANNQLELYEVISTKQKEKTDTDNEYERTISVDLAGHRADVRALSISGDDRMLATASSGQLKIWNIRTQACLRTLECGYALCCTFLPGDKIVLVGNKTGEIELFDISSSSLIDTIKAHDGPIWTVKVHPDGKSVVTGSADKSAKFWNFEIVQEDVPGTKRTTSRLALVQTRVLKVNDDVLSLCHSPDSKLIAVSTLDNTVKVFFADTLKLFLTLYGHKLPVLHMSIAADSKLIATCSADKNVRLWGLDFGDCHKTFFAHDESIMQVGFIPEPDSREDRHLFFSASKDGLLKHWDGDKFEQVQKLRGHHGEIWAMAVSRTGDFVVTASHDKSIRIWSRTDEPLFLEEERERELEESYDQNVAENMEKDHRDEMAMMEANNGQAEVTSASKQTTATLTANEKITEALNLCLEDLSVVKEHEEQKTGNPSAKHAPPQRHPLLALRNTTAEAHLLSVFQAISAAALQDALLLLTFPQLTPLFTFISIWLQKEMDIPLTCRILFFLLRTHHKSVVASQDMRLQLDEMRERLRSSLAKWKNVMGFNLAATRMLGQRVSDGKVKTIEDYEKVERSGKKRTFVNVQ